MRGIRLFQMSIHLPGVAPGIAPRAKDSAGWGSGATGWGAAGCLGLLFAGLPAGGLPDRGPFRFPLVPLAMPLPYPARAARYRVRMIGIIALVFAALAALLHVYIFILESVRWTTPAVWRRFGVADQQAAEITRPMAYNQGFYNLFLAVGAGLGILLFAMGGPDALVAGRTLVLFSLGSMVAAALVLTTTGLKYLRAALLQGTLPLIGFVLMLFA